MTTRLEARVAQVRRRALVRAWEYRQRRHAHGVWFRLRRALADANAAFVVADADARALAKEGCRTDPVGHELDPPKLIVWASPERIARLPSAQRLGVRLSAELLAAGAILLSPFEAVSQRSVEGLARGASVPRSRA